MTLLQNGVVTTARTPLELAHGCVSCTIAVAGTRADLLGHPFRLGHRAGSLISSSVSSARRSAPRITSGLAPQTRIVRAVCRSP